jgi:hypothetical protein
MTSEETLQIFRQTGALLADLAKIPVEKPRSK